MPIQGLIEVPGTPLMPARLFERGPDNALQMIEVLQRQVGSVAPGPPGPPGEPGVGTQGTPGYFDIPGISQIMGPPGVNGTPGIDGTPGTNGTNGTNGTPGTPGTPGTNGTPGADGATGPQGPQGDPGPKGSFVKNEEGIYEFACVEASRPYFFHVRRMTEALPKKFIAAVGPDVIEFESRDKRFVLALGIRREYPDWIMPHATEQQYRHSRRFWQQEYIPGGML